VDSILSEVLTPFQLYTRQH